MTASSPLVDPAGGHAWSDDEPDLPDALRLSPAAAAERAAQRARIDAAQPTGQASPDPSAPSTADPFSPSLRCTRRAPRKAGSAGARAAAARAEFESAAWPTFAPPALGAASGPMADVMEAERALARATAARSHALTALADARPGTGDRPAGTPGAMSDERSAARPSVLLPVSEWVVRELRVSLAVTDHAADRMLVQALTLTRRLPGVLAALEGGTIHCGHLPALLELLDPIADDTLRARIEAELLRWLGSRGAAGTITTPAQLRAKIHRVLLARDARTQAETLRRALATRGVFTSADPVPGMSGIHLRMTTAEAAALHAALDQLGADLPDTDHDSDRPDMAPRRSRAEKMLDVLLDSVLRPGSSTHPPVQISLTVVAALETLLGSDTPGEIDGHLVPAAQIRALLDLLTGAHLAADVAADQPDDPQPDVVGAATDPADVDTVGHRPGQDAPANVTPDDAMAPAGVGPSAGGAAHPEPPTPDDATYWALVDHLIATAPDPGDMWFDPEDPLWPEHDTRPEDTPNTPGGALRSRAGTLDDQRPTRSTNARPADRHASPTVQHPTDAADAGVPTDAPDTGAPTVLDALRAAAPADVAALRDLLASTTSTSDGGLAHRPRLALTHALTGALISLTDLPGLHTAAGTATDLGAPPGIDAYRPTAALDRHVRTRDRRCRTPGCRRPASRGQLDHHVPHPQGPTSATNLCGLCLTDHRGKHQAPGWHHDLRPDGTYTVTTPAGLTARTTPTPVL